MRVWEIADSRVLPSDLVREQDFIMRVRRMQRQGARCLVINFILNAIDALVKNREAMVEIQKKLEEFAQGTKGSYYEMSNGDVFIAWENPTAASLGVIREVEKILSGFITDARQTIATYHMPENYSTLRERTNYYVEIVHTATMVGGAAAAEKEVEAHGQLTAKNIDQVEQVLGEIDLRRYGRTQKVYHNVSGAWVPVGEEFFISFEDLRRERFPKLELTSSPHFFLSLCSVLDERLLTMFTSSYETIAGRMVSLNVSVVSIMGSVFARFVHGVPHDQRHLIGFEIHCGDLFLDFSQALGAIDILRREGFRVMLDNVTPDMVGYVDFGAFDVDGIKINVSKDRAQMLEDPAIRTGLARLPPDKLVFYRCDNKRALDIGLDLEVSAFQGWLIDDLAAKKK